MFWFSVLSSPDGPRGRFADLPLDSRRFRLSDSLGTWGTGNSTPVSLDASAPVCWSLCCFLQRWLGLRFEALLGAGALAIRSISLSADGLGLVSVVATWLLFRFRRCRCRCLGRLGDARWRSTDVSLRFGDVRVSLHRHLTSPNRHQASPNRHGGVPQPTPFAAKVASDGSRAERHGDPRPMRAHPREHGSSRAARAWSSPRRNTDEMV